MKEDIKQNNNANNVDNNLEIEKIEIQNQNKIKEKKKKSMTEDDLDSGKRNKSLEFEDVKFNIYFKYSSKKSVSKNKLDSIEKLSSINENNQQIEDKNSQMLNIQNNNINIE